MTHHPIDLLPLQPLSARRPPSGKSLAARLSRRAPGETGICELARLAGRTEGAVAWLLRQDMIVPADLLRAALALESQAAAQLGSQEGAP
jgi:hypothetical protein